LKLDVMQVLVVGATGTLGRQIARQALDAGHAVRCMVRSPRKASFLQEWGCELTRGDLLEPDSLDYALEGQEAVIDAATARATDPGQRLRHRLDGQAEPVCRLPACRCEARWCSCRCWMRPCTAMCP
jgi:uncharacterized protein YbjT (DUF2867 family)